MPTISVVTAVDPERSRHLPDAYASLLRQELPDGWDWQWLVQCDDADEDAQDMIRQYLPRSGEDDRVSYGANRHRGPGVARTMTLARATGGLIKVLDADDQLADGVLARDIHVHRSERGLGWTASRVTDVHTDGSETPHHSERRSAGRIKSLGVYAAWSRDYTILVHPASLCIKLRPLVALGGWMSLPAGEDTGLLLALDAIADGWLHDEIGLYYRRWDDQMTAQPEHIDPEELAARRAITSMRHDALCDMCN